MSTKIGIVHVTCVSCGVEHTISVPAAAYRRWATGKAKIQDALPMLTADERELLLSGMCPHCFDKLMGG